MTDINDPQPRPSAYPNESSLQGAATNANRRPWPPEWLRKPTQWVGFAALFLALLAIVEVFEPGDNARLTSVRAAQGMLLWAAPILLAGLGGLFSERAGVVNIGLEGMMIFGTWFGAWGALQFGTPWAGLVAGVVGGAIGGLIHAVATVSFGVDHVISGVAINIIAPGFVKFMSSVVWDNPTQSPGVSGLPKFSVPLLAGGFGTPDLLGWIDDLNILIISDWAGFAKGLMSGMSIFTLLAYLLVPVTAWLVWKTPFGLRLRIAGERPEAGESLGVNIYFYKYAGVIMSGALAGLGGAFIAQELNNFFQNGQTSGRGFIGLAALIFGNWKPGGVLVAALLFGYPFGTSLLDASDRTSTHALILVVALGMLGVTVWAFMRRRAVDVIVGIALAIVLIAWYALTATAPTFLPNTLPYALVLLVLIFANQRLRPPAADGLPYRRGET